MHQRPSPPPPLIPPAVVAWLRKPQFLIPIAVVVGMTVIAFGVQPSGAQGETPSKARTTPTSLVAQPSTTAIATPTSQPQQTATQQAQASATGTMAVTNAQGQQTATSDVAGVRGTPAATATAEADLSRQSTQCGAIQETAVPLAVEQSINGVSVKATKASTYPIEYFRCILMATGGQEATSLSSAVSKAQSSGMTHAVLVDLWITNAGRDFGQVNLKEAQLAAAGQVFSPLATLGGRAEVVVSSGQGRNVTLVVAIKNTVGATTGPVTLTINAPLFGGQPTQGKYSLFLPTP